MIKEKSTSILKEADRRHNRAFKFNNNSERDLQSLLALDQITVGEMKEILKTTLEKKTQRNVTVLLYADGRSVPDNIKSSFNNLDEWKSTQTYK